jgi:hypothetical protein
MCCEERDKLLDLLLETTRVYSDTVRAMIGREGEALKCVRRLVAISEVTCDDCLEVLEAHERSHGCVPKAKETTTS